MPLLLDLPQNLTDRLDKLAEMTGKNKALLILEAVSDHMSDLEDFYKADKRWKDIESGKEGTYTLKEMMEKHGV